VEQRNYTQRKRTLEFDDVMNKQRMVIYDFRNEVINTDTPNEIIEEIIDESIPERVQGFLDVQDGSPDIDGLRAWVETTFPISLSAEELPEGIATEAASKLIVSKVKETYELKKRAEDSSNQAEHERYVLLGAIDRLWQEHLYSMDALRDGVHLRSFAQKDPLIEYKMEAYSLFSALMSNIRGEILQNLFRQTSNIRAYEQLLHELMSGASAQQQAAERQGPPPSAMGGGTFTASSGAMAYSAPTPEPAEDPNRPRIQMPDENVVPQLPPGMPKVGRNDACPCASGKKFKNCHGRGIV
jgi:preprotein translocase subunit SecA